MTVERALANSLAWYHAMMDAHGIPHETDANMWICRERVPPYYSNLVTRTCTGTTRQLRRIEAFASEPPARPWSVADSYASLDEEALRAWGLQLLLEAQWFGGRSPRTGSPETGTTFERVDTCAALVSWEARWKRWSPTDEDQVFPPSLLEAPDVAFWTLVQQGTPIGGALTHGHEDTLGLSNVFTNGAAASGAHLRDAARHALRVAGARAVVGYGGTSELAALAPLGFEAWGPKRVFITGP